MDLSFSDVNVFAGKKQILKNVCGSAEPGHLLAIMGPSGSGKTTLLNTLAGRRHVQSGEITLNGTAISKRTKRKICYVLQQDIFFPNLTLLETLSFAAMLRLPDSMPKDEKIKKMFALIDDLDLRKCVNTVIGDMWQPGLSGGEKKRVNIACELITDPTIILLDEPTSGLDYKSAFSLIKILKNYTEQYNKTVVTTIHQPSSQIFHLFDKLLLMCDGHSCYYGDPVSVTDFFSGVGYPMAAHYNPADFILEKLKESPEVQEKIIAAGYEFRKSGHVQEIKSVECDDDIIEEDSKIENPTSASKTAFRFPWKRKKKQNTDIISDSGSVHISLMELDAAEDQSSEDDDRKWPTGFLTQYKQLTWRTFKLHRSRIVDKFKLFETAFLGVLLCLVWFQLPRVEDTLRDRMGVIFYISMHWGFTPLFDSVTSFPSERGVINKERASGWYRLSAYYLAKMTSELPLILIQPIIFLSLVYWIVGLNSAASSFFGVMGTIFVHSIAGQSIGLCIGIFCMDMRRGISVGTIIILFIMLLGGFYTRNLPFWLDWVKYLAFLHHTYHCLMYLEFSGTDLIQCATETNSTQSQFESCHHGNITEIPSQEMLWFYGIDSPYWVYLLPLFVFIVVFRLLGYLMLRFYQKPH